MKFLILCVSTLLIGLISAQQSGSRDSRCPSNENPQNPTHLAHASDCTKFYKCSQGLAYELSCPTGQHWNRGYSYCDSIERAHCTSNGPPQWNQSPINHPTYLNCPQFDNSGPTVYFPHHLSCSNFYQCNNGRAIYLTCPAGHHWNAARSYCDTPTNANCRIQN
ncbi:unnamed protein product [Diamesa serratosioi]